jgi:hypothetical protein
VSLYVSTLPVHCQVEVLASFGTSPVAVLIASGLDLLRDGSGAGTSVTINSSFAGDVNEDDDEDDDDDVLLSDSESGDSDGLSVESESAIAIWSEM